MTFSKSFARYVKGSNYPRWEDISLTEKEEREQEEKARKENIELMNRCIEDARKIIDKQNLKRFQSDLVRVAITLFEKRASHVAYHKESKAKEKFDRMFSK